MQNSFPIFPMPLLLQTPTLLQLLKLYATLFIGIIFFLPFLFFAFTCISFSFFIIIPFLCTIISAIYLCKSLLLSLIRSPEMKLKNFQGTASKSTRGSKAIGKRVIEGLSDKEVSVELNPFEFPSLCESEEEEMVKVEIHRVCMFEQDSWQILFPKSIKKEEQQSVCRNLFSYDLYVFIFLLK